MDQIDLFKNSVQQVKKKHPFQIKAYVILPEHLYMIWELFIGDSNYSERWKKIKTLFSKHMYRSGVKLYKTKHHEYHLWQRRFWEHTIRDLTDLENHIHYIHYNPIKHNLVENLHDWPHSSFHHYVRNGRLSENWASLKTTDPHNICFGE